MPGFSPNFPRLTSGRQKQSLPFDDAPQEEINPRPSIQNPQTAEPRGEGNVEQQSEAVEVSRQQASALATPDPFDPGDSLLWIDSSGSDKINLYASRHRIWDTVTLRACKRCKEHRLQVNKVFPKHHWRYLNDVRANSTSITAY